jgi:signal transduction histidine kinase
MTNIHRHACARSVKLTLAQNDGFFLGEILDDGQGFDPSLIRSHPDKPQGLGLAGMQERILQRGGQFEISSRSGQGTRILIRIPVQEAGNG